MSGQMAAHFLLCSEINRKAFIKAVLRLEVYNKNILENNQMKQFCRFLIFTGLVLVLFQSVRAQSNAPLVLVLNANGVVAPALEEYIQRGIQTAEQRDADL